ncbi:Uncharacterised protein [Brachyspira pilosicoli]|uniref:ATP-binding protein n=1 Tax=Brachyspira pilosicoli TaxID=52584 RepID=UPI000E159CC0|nr:ATP-binding protein [Brachyspira pilosicoli]SUW07292.1 Uncharacterised protein [Brachyspira pilosicoli]
MKQNISGKIRNLSMSTKQAFKFSIYEAISNSIHSIHIKELTNTSIDININYKNGIVEDMEIIDYAEGFTSNNFNTFLEAEKTSKEKYGCKGLGRFTWLLAFENVYISSVFSENGKVYKRTFNFNTYWDNETPTEENTKVEIKTDTNNKTSIRFSKPKDKFSYKKITNIIIDHFLAQFFLLNEEGYNLKINITHSLLTDEKNEKEFEDINIIEFKYRDKQKFDLYDYGNKTTFELYHVFTNYNNSKKHQILLCAGLRKVKSKKFEHFPDDYIFNEDKSEKFSSYLAVICSDFLDKKVSLDRGNLSLKSIEDYEEDEYNFENEKNFIPITDETIFNEVKELSNKYLEENKYTIKWNEDREKRIEDFKKEHIYLNPLLKDVNILWSDKYDDIYNKVNQKKINKEKEVKKHINKLINTLEKNDNKDLTTSKEFTNAIKEATNLNSIELSAYVYYRKYALSLLDNLISYKNITEQDYYLEEKIHNFLFPMGKTSEEVEYDEHNLWVIDDRWAFYKHIFSNKQLKTSNPDTNSQKRPDILIFSENKEREINIDKVLIIELKRPGIPSDHYDPHEQVLNNIIEIWKSKSLKNNKGKVIPISNNVIFYAYILSDYNSKFINNKAIISYRYREAPDGTYYLYQDATKDNPTINFNIIPYTILHSIAYDRNLAFISKLDE